MTTFTDRRACEKDSGLLIRDCHCPDCENFREEFIELHVDLAKTYLSNRSEEEKADRRYAIERHIKRYKQWL